MLIQSFFTALKSQIKLGKKSFVGVKSNVNILTAEQI